MPPTTLLDWLLRAYPASKRQTLKRMVESGRVQVNGRPATKLKTLLAPKDKVVVLDRPSIQKHQPSPENLPFAIVFEDADLLVVNKPAGLLTSTVPNEKRPTLLAAVRDYVAQTQRMANVGLIHRLDRDVGGLLVFSKNDSAYQSLKSQFFHHSVHREYRAIVHGVPKPPAGRIENRLVELANGSVRATRVPGKGQRAVTQYELRKSQGNRSLVKIVLHTGRKHQIRTHLASKGNPVVGDAVYGPDPEATRPMLAAVRLTLKHPRLGNELTFTAPIPEDFAIRE
jgi:23S rRNA pseudouridine1911/1915/1917 synthase